MARKVTQKGTKRPVCKSPKTKKRKCRRQASYDCCEDNEFGAVVMNASNETPAVARRIRVSPENELEQKELVFEATITTPGPMASSESFDDFSDDEDDQDELYADDFEHVEDGGEQRRNEGNPPKQQATIESTIADDRRYLVDDGNMGRILDVVQGISAVKTDTIVRGVIKIRDIGGCDQADVFMQDPKCGISLSATTTSYEDLVKGVIRTQKVEGTTHIGFVKSHEIDSGFALKDIIRNITKYNTSGPVHFVVVSEETFAMLSIYGSPASMPDPGRDGHSSAEDEYTGFYFTNNIYIGSAVGSDASEFAKTHWG